MEHKRQKVLVVEPSGEWRDLITFVLAGCGYNVVNVRPCNAVAEAASLRPDLILLDLAVTEFSDDGILRRLKTNPLTSAIPIITETAQGDEQRAREAMADGADEVLYKPYGLGNLATVLRQKLPPVTEA